MMRPPVGRGQCWTTGYAVVWRRVRGGVEEAATGADCCCRVLVEWWCAWSTRLWGRAVGCRIFCLHESFLDVFVDSYSFPNELLFAGLMASFIQVTAGQPAMPLAGWQSWWAWLSEGSSACQGQFSLFVEVHREAGSERVVFCVG